DAIVRAQHEGFAADCSFLRAGKRLLLAGLRFNSYTSNSSNWATSGRATRRWLDGICRADEQRLRQRGNQCRSR
ncbi:unnamed protein product, partial [Polarella glacialis]